MLSIELLHLGGAIENQFSNRPADLLKNRFRSMIRFILRRMNLFFTAPEF